MKVCFISDWFESDNPYKVLLIKHLLVQNIQVQEYPKKRFFLLEILQEGKPDIVHLHTCKYFFISHNIIFQWLKFRIFTAQLFCLKFIGIKVIWTVHEWNNKISGKKHSFPILLTKILGRVFDGIITHCDSTKTQIIKELYIANPEKVCVIPHGNYIGWYDDEITPHQSRQILGLEENSFVFLIFGGIHWGKGILEGIEAFKKLPQHKINLIIAGKTGSKKLRDAILNAIRNSPNINLFALDEGIPDKEVQIYLKACNCFLLPYTAFTTSGVALMAMSFSKVCIAPNCGFFQDIFDKNRSFLYDVTEPDSLVNTMQAAIDSQKLLPAMGLLNLELAKKWNWDYVAKKTAKLYSQSVK